MTTSNGIQHLTKRITVTQVHAKDHLFVPTASQEMDKTSDPEQVNLASSFSIICKGFWRLSFGVFQWDVPDMDFVMSKGIKSL